MADRSKKYWLLVILGYSIQVLSIPLLALVPENGWIVASSLIILERTAKALKKPAKNSLVSFASSEIGVGKGFAYLEMLDQLGAFIGPIIVFVLAYFSPLGDTLSSYRKSFTFLLIPALITIVLVLYSWRRYPHPEIFEKEEKKEKVEYKTKPSFVLFMAAISLFVFGFADFSLISLSAMEKDIFPSSAISLLYALAMTVDAVAALAFGFLYDKIGIKSLIAATVFHSSLSLPFFLPRVFR